MAMSDTAMSEPRTSEQAETVKLAGYRRQIARLPLTMRPSLNRQLGQWETLFPYERGRLAVLLRGVAALCLGGGNAVALAVERSA